LSPQVFFLMVVMSSLAAAFCRRTACIWISGRTQPARAAGIVLFKPEANLARALHVACTRLGQHKDQNDQQGRADLAGQECIASQAEPREDDDPRLGQHQHQSEAQEDDGSAAMIYEGLLTTQVRLVKAFSLATSVVGLAFQPILFYHSQQLTANVSTFLAAGAFFSFFTLGTPLLIHSVCKKYVTAMYYDKRKRSYTAVTYGLMLTRKRITFRPEDVRVPDVPGPFTTFLAGGVPLFVDGDQFSAIEHFGKIMGYDKPINMRYAIEPYYEPI